MTPIILSGSRAGQILSYVLTEIIVLLSVLQMFLTASVPALKIFQIPVEILLGVFLIIGCLTIKHSRSHALLIIIFVTVTVLSLVNVSVSIFMVAAKQHGLAVLALLYFSKRCHKSTLIPIVVLATLSLLLMNFFSPKSVAAYINLASDTDFNNSRFGGVFLNVHFNAFFLATALIYYSYKTHLFGIGFLIITITASKFILVSYVGNQIGKLRVFQYLSKSQVVRICILALSFAIFLINSQEIISFFDSEPFGLSLNSASVILMQLADPVYYTIMLNPLPSDVISVSDRALALYPGHDGYIEVGYFALASRSGIFFGGLYLFFLLRKAFYFRIFILLGLLHLNYIFSPLIIYMFLTYSKEIKIILAKK